MFVKFRTICGLIFALLYTLTGHATGANRLDQYGVYGTLDDDGSSSSSTTTVRYNAAMRCINVNPQQYVDLEQVRIPHIYIEYTEILELTHTYSAIQSMICAC